MLRRRATNTEVEEPQKETSPPTVPHKKSGSLLLKIFFFILFIVYIVIPFSVYLCPAVRRHAVFLNYVRLSRQRNLSMPIESGLTCTRSFYIASSDNVQLGTWHVPPQSRCNGKILSIDEEFKDNKPIFLYLHGNAGTRGGGHRIELYKLLSNKLDAHILAFDYRGFGDSSNVSPTEPGLVEDTEHVFNWIRERAPASRITIWGHSLGTGVAVAFMHKILHAPYSPFAVILEAPFTKIIDAASHHPMSIFHRYMPFFDTLIAQPIGDKETGFDSISRIRDVKSPLLILHAEDDGFVPYDHGKKLYEEALSGRGHLKAHVTEFVGFEEKFDHGHKYICDNPNLPNIVKSFFKKVSSLPM